MNKYLTNQQFLTDVIYYKEHRIEIGYDRSPESPREWDNLGVCSFKDGYNFGDKKAPKFETISEFYDFIKKENGIHFIVCKAYSGITTSESFNNGFIGFIYATSESIKKEFNCKRISKKTKNKIKKILLGEIETLNKYILGEIYMFNIINSKGEYIDSLYGIYDKDEAIDEAKSSIDHEVEKVNNNSN